MIGRWKVNKNLEECELKEEIKKKMNANKMNEMFKEWELEEED